MRVPRNFRWAAGRTREVWIDEGWEGLRLHTRRYLKRRRMLGDTSPGHKRLPSGPIGDSAWPPSLVMVAYDYPIQCYHYRVQQKREACEKLGIPFRVVNPLIPDDVVGAVQLASVLILYRIGAGPAATAAIEQARRLRIPVVYEVDDAVYRRDLLEDNPNLRTVPRSLQRSVIRGADDYLQVLRQANHTLASTRPLATDMAGNTGGGSSFVMENGIDAEMLTIAQGIRKDPAPPSRPDDAVVISYGSGSRAHDFDLEVAAPGIAQVMQANPAVILHVVGPVKLPDVLAPFSDRVERTSSVSYPEYLRQLAAADISIAPLADLPFNHFKSQIKYLEAALVGVPFVASETVYGDYVVDGATGFTASDPAAWAKALNRLVREPALRGELAEAAANDVKRFYVNADPARQLAEMMAALA